MPSTSSLPSMRPLELSTFFFPSSCSWVYSFQGFMAVRHLYLSDRLHQIENHRASWSRFVLFQSLLSGDLFWLSRECKGLRNWICHFLTFSLVRKSLNFRVILCPEMRFKNTGAYIYIYNNGMGTGNAWWLLGLFLLDLLNSRVVLHPAQVQKEELPASPPLVLCDFTFSSLLLLISNLLLCLKHVPLILLMVSVASYWTRWLYHKLRPTQRWTVMKRGCQVPSSGQGGRYHPKHDDQPWQTWCTKAHDGGTKQD